MRSLSAALSTALGAAVQQPAILVEVGFAVTRRWSSLATVAWNSLTWLQEEISLDGLLVDAMQVRGTLSLGNSDDAMGALVLAEDVADKSIKVWGYDAAATALADVVMLCDAVGGAVTIDERRVQISLRGASELMLAPRTFVGPSSGFNSLLPSGVVLNINGLDFKLERR